jgi:hypothetical protein
MWLAWASLRPTPATHRGATIKDMQAHLETLRAQIAECQRLQRAAKSKIKRDIFQRLVVHYEALAGELEQAIAAMRTKETEE